MEQHLIITGGSRGIGFATAKRFIEAGWQVTNVSRHPCPIPPVKQVTWDLAQTDWSDAPWEQLTADLKKPSQICLIHNASSCPRDRADAMDIAALAQQLQLDLLAPARLNQHVIPFMAEGSSVLYIGSTLSEKAVANNASYITSKHAVVGLMRATCQDLAGRGIHTACLCPGVTDTEMLHERVNNDPVVLKQLAQLSAFNRFVAPEEIADTLYFCANHPVVNGSVLHANLGQIER